MRTLHRSLFVLWISFSAAWAAEIKTNVFCTFDRSKNGVVDNANLNAGTEVGTWNVLVRCDSFMTNGVLHTGIGRYGFQLWVPPAGTTFISHPSVHMEFLAATTQENSQWNQIVFKDIKDRNLLSLRFNAWAALQRWNGKDWVGPLETSLVRGSGAFPVVLNELDIDFMPDGADIYYNGALVEKSVSYLPYGASPVIRHIALTGLDENSAAWYDNIRIKSWGENPLSSE